MSIALKLVAAVLLIAAAIWWPDRQADEEWQTYQQWRDRMKRDGRRR